MHVLQNVKCSESALKHGRKVGGGGGGGGGGCISHIPSFCSPFVLKNLPLNPQAIVLTSSRLHEHGWHCKLNKF